jgi:hypothetical protein
MATSFQILTNSLQYQQYVKDMLIVNICVLI